MNHSAATCRGALHQCGIGNITLDQLKARVAQLQVVALASGKVVEHTHRVAFSQQRIAQVGANEAGAAGDQDGGVSHGGRNGPVEAAGRRARHAA
ncbi:hypothetical protein D3C73_1300890 [compost metagenome]